MLSVIVIEKSIIDYILGRKTITGNNYIKLEHTCKFAWYFCSYN